MVYFRSSFLRPHDKQPSSPGLASRKLIEWSSSKTSKTFSCCAATVYGKLGEEMCQRRRDGAHVCLSKWSDAGCGDLQTWMINDQTTKKTFPPTGSPRRLRITPLPRNLSPRKKSGDPREPGIALPSFMIQCVTGILYRTCGQCQIYTYVCLYIA